MTETNDSADLTTAEKTGLSTRSEELAERGLDLANRIIGQQPSDIAGPTTLPSPTRRTSVDFRLAKNLEAHTCQILSVAFSPDGRLLATGSHSELRLWRTSDWTLARTLQPVDCSADVSFSPSGRILATRGYCFPVELWRVADGSHLHTLGDPDLLSDCSNVVFSMDERVLAVGAHASRVGAVSLWRVEDGEALGAWPWSQASRLRAVWSLVLSPDGEILALGDAWGQTGLELWRWQDRAFMSCLQGHDQIVNSIAFSPDGKVLASGAGDTTVRLWRTADSSPVRILNRHTDAVWHVAFSPDGTLLTSASYDGRILVWNVSTGMLLHSLEGQLSKASMPQAVFSPDGRLLLSAVGSGTIGIWRVRREDKGV